ncbi:1-aminocyclopropane-1-carboxylate deaminase/D-cysteine desulfhydrase [Membranihabitans marinus]|uniref:1-aminocyclopropane-1-carboxylate deaminase/D-cysteine desulfhydrase n=1 Tax=Membranihabitans marinus TaxID=1227546 RepID=UPI001F369E45|nr:pyridoxal-phosphate dependent enzyme [Membranihabitans marinus]
MLGFSPLERIDYSLFNENGVSVFVKRDDELHPVVSGNKFRKLKYIIEEYKTTQSYKGIVSFGGAFSNHIHALAYLCRQENIPCVLLVRSAGGKARENPTLDDVRQWGADLIFLSDGQYKQRANPSWYEKEFSQYSDYLWIPEGGSHPLSLRGVAESLSETREEFDSFNYIICPVGTGATLAGLASVMKSEEELWGISALKGSQFDQSIKRHWQLESHHIKILTQWHFGGYGKAPTRLQEFLKEFYRQTGLLLDPIYNGKSMFALCEMIKCGLIARGNTVFFLHTGGLQGWRGYQNK